MEINQVGPKQYISTNYRAKRAMEHLDEIIFEKTDSPARPYKRNKFIEDKY